MIARKRLAALAAVAVLATLGAYSRRPAARPPQPVAFTHIAHVAAGLRCMDCHADASISPRAGLPDVQECVLCHTRIRTQTPAVRQVLRYAAAGKEIPWRPVYVIPASAHVRFRHDAHVKADIACSNCHPAVARETTARVSAPLGMGTCVGCHRRYGAATECETCHY